MANHFGWMSLTAQLLLMIALTLNYKKYKPFIIGWLIVESLGIAIYGTRSRTGLMVLLASLVTTYHFSVKRFTMRAAGILCVAGLLLFTGLGLMRLLSDYAAGTDAGVLAANNEFESLFANAYELNQAKAAGLTDEIFPAFYFADFSNLVPQQLTPFRKIDLSEWYARTFHPAYAEAGGGFAFGAISEAIVG